MTKALELAKFGRETPPTGLVVGDSDTQTLSAKTFSDMPVLSAGIVNGVAYLNGSKALTTSSNLIFNGTILTVSDIRDSSLTSGRVTYAGAAGNLIDSANLVFTGTSLGVGTSSPQSQFHVSGTSTVSIFESTSGPVYFRFAAPNGINNGYIGYGDGAAETMTFWTSGQERMRITSSGRLGVGTTTPQNRLDLGGPSAGRGVTWENYDNVFSEYSSGALYLSSNYYGNTDSVGFKTSVTASFGAAGISVSGTSGGGNSGLIQFFVDPTTSKTAGATFTPTERMRISSAGNLSIGSVNNPSDPGILVSRGNNTGIILLDDEATGRGAYIRSTGSSVEFGSTSSVRPVVFTLDRAERARIDTAGNFLVGTNALASGFSTFAQIQASGTTGGVLINSATNNIGRLMFTNNNTSGGEGLIRYDGNDKSMQFWTNAGERMRITSTGNVGIGTSSPSATLTVAGVLRVENSGTGAFGIQAVGGAGAARDIFLAGQSGYSNGFTVRYNGTNMAYAFQDGDVAIGDTTASGYRLKVTGTANVTGALVVGSYASMGSIVANDPGAGYYSYNNRIGGALAVVGTLYNAGNLFANRFTLNQGSSGTTRTAGTVAAGWYRFARSDFASGGFGGRGGCTFYMYTTGGWSGPGQTKIELFKDYSTNGNLTVDTKGNYYFTNWRIAMDNNYAYLEGWTNGFNFGGDNTFNTIVDAYGWDAGGWTLYSEPLTAGLSSPSYIIRASYINLNGRTLERNIGTAGSEPDDFVTVNGISWQSAFDNPTIDLFTFPTPTTIYPNLICEVEVWQTPWSNVSTGSVHVGFANYGNQGSIKNVTTMTMKNTMPSGAQGNVGTLSWNGNTLRYTSNRASNYDHYSLKYTVRHQEVHNIQYYY